PDPRQIGMIAHLSWYAGAGNSEAPIHEILTRAQVIAKSVGVDLERNLHRILQRAGILTGIARLGLQAHFPLLDVDPKFHRYPLGSRPALSLSRQGQQSASFRIQRTSSKKVRQCWCRNRDTNREDRHDQY